MSNYPPASYGASYGAQDQTNATYLPPTYPNQYMQQEDGRAGQTHIASNYDTSMSAYGYNNSVPGFSAGALASGAPPLPIFQGWNTDPTPLPAYTALHNNMQYTGYSSNSYQNPQPFSAPSAQQSYYQNTQPVKPYDEGEVSEGEFEDTYTPQNAPPAAAVDFASNYYRGNDGTGYMDTAHRAVYARGQDYGNQQYASNDHNNNHRNSSQTRRQQSGSYSPYAASTADAGQDDHSKPSQNHNTYTPSHSAEQHVNGTSHNSHQPSWTQSNGIPASSKSNLQTNGKLALQNKEKSVEHATVDAQSVPLVKQTQPVNGGISKSVLEARKKAEAAILNLWVHEVRFPNYIEEGLDENIVGRLFDDLKLSRAPSKSQNGASPLPQTGETSNRGQIQQLVEPSTFPREPVAQPLSVHSLTGNDGNSPLANSSKTQISNLSSTNTASTVVQAKPAELNDKEKTLQMKMEALRKSREKRAQKAETKTNPMPSTVPVVATPSQPEPSNSPTVQKTVETPSASPSSPLPQIQATKPHIASILPTIAAPPAPVIPGLFLASTSSPAPPTTSNNTMYNTLQNLPRKRPVAADFDTSASPLPFKRPFGQSRNDQLVIDVSEDEPDTEDEDVAMDLESQADQESPIQSARKMSDQRIATIQNLPPLSNFPVRKTLTSPPISSAASTPPVHSTSKTALGHPQVLQQKETEIELLKKKIAEAEAKAKRRAQQSSSGARTPQQPDINNNSEMASQTGDIVSRVEASIQMQQLISINEEQVSSDQKRLAETQAAELEKAAELKRQEAESRRLRREKIATEELPHVNAEIQRRRLKLEQLRAEIARAEADVRKGEEDQAKMAAEMERLGQAAENELQEQKEKLKDLTNNETAAVSGVYNTFPSTSHCGIPRSLRNVSFAAGDHQTHLAGSPHPTTSPAAEMEVDQVNLPSRQAGLPHISSQSTIPSAKANHEDAVLPAVNMVPATNGLPLSSISVDKPSKAHEVECTDGTTSDQALESALQEAVRADTDSHAQNDDYEMDVENSYAPDPAELAPESSSSQNEDKQGDTYSPIPELATAVVPDRESDDYEPPEATPPTDMPSPMESPPFSPAPPELITDIEHDQFDFPGFGQRMDDDNDVGELQVNGSVPQLIEDTEEESNQTQFYTPYESPLKVFRAFRFHPEFSREVTGGLRSLTYSNKIDAQVELCRYELAGGFCNDQTCEFQHFRDLGLPDDTILSMLGSPEEFPLEQQQKFREGLRQVLTSLRARKVRDFDTIAAEVVAHRSKFLGDTSKVLMLEGTTI